ncbi:hypothetical protein HSBAA_17380 [Vreelandella sulfidaeris]|uniref:Solute-binding protein family 5 domain-containing protein n=1 Tax=Vreelandella sulfidaeris TaxID=115553 RepID=A0A455U309_9GAMM|nr:hypothetical protein HSBAA_17380 [Halomonas sulfidaeris]
MTLRDDARFSDGTSLTAADVAYTFNTAAQAGGRADLSALAEAAAVDEKTVTLRLHSPRITFIDQLLTLGIVPHAKRKNGYNDSYGRYPLGSGPHQLVEWQEGEQLIVERNPYFYGPSPAFDRLVFLFTGEDATLSAAHAGQADIAAIPPALAANVPADMQRVIMESVDNRGILFPCSRVMASMRPLARQLVTMSRQIPPSVRRSIWRLIAICWLKWPCTALVALPLARLTAFPGVAMKNE